MRKRQKFLALVIMINGIQLIASPSAGVIKGSIVDRDTQQPLIGANIILDGTTMGAATDIEGHFEIRNVPVGSYSIRAHMIGYREQARANIHSVANRPTMVNLALEPTVLEGQDIVVTAGYFERVKDATVSVRTVDIEEIQSDPVGAYDILSMMQSLPSVVSGADQSNEIIVRGGAPGENLFVMDHLDIPYPVHYPSQGAGGGPVTMVNTEFIERIDFFAGSFPARYGDKLSSVMDVTVREGHRSGHEVSLGLNMAGFGGIFEGPMGDNASYIGSIQRSFLDFIIGQSGLMSVPQYWTFQGKLTYDLNPREKMYVNYLGGIDAIDIEGDDSPQARGVEYVNWRSQQHTIGLTYKNLYSDAGYIIGSLGYNRVGMEVDVYNAIGGERDSDFFLAYDLEEELIHKLDIVYKPKKNLELSGGIKAKWSRATNDAEFFGAELIYWGYAPDSSSPALPISAEIFNAEYLGNENAVIRPLDTLDINEGEKSDELVDLGSFGIHSQLRWHPTALWEITLGGRLEYQGFIKEIKFSPRLNISRLITEQVKLNMAAGRYFQPPFYYHYVREGEDARDLDFYYANQVTAGMEWLAREDLRITMEAYTKEFHDMVVMEMVKNPVSGADSTTGNYVNAGAGRSRGLEFFIQKKFSNNWYSTFSYAYSVSEGVDLRKEGTVYYPWDYDYRNVLNLIGGVKIRYMDKDWYQRYNETWIAGVTSWLPVAPSDEYEIAVRLRYSGGRPYTPKHYNHNLRQWYTFDSDDWNSERHGDYIRFDIMLLQRHYGEKVNLVSFWDFMNVFNRDNPWDWMYFDDGTKEMAWQFKTFPIGGVTIEF